jgi:hypothetical protein
MSDELEEALYGVAMGDQEQITRVAAYLRSNEQNVRSGQSAVQQELAVLQGQKKFLTKVLAWARDNPDVAFSDEDYVHCVEVDAALAKNYPNMTEEDRLQRATEITREALGAAEDRDHASAIAQIAAGRSKNPNMPNEKSARHSRDPEDVERSEVIEQMRQARMPHFNEAADAAQERAAREPQRARTQRASPWAPR